MVRNMVYLVFVFKEWVFIWQLRSFIESLIMRLKKSYSTDYILQNFDKTVKKQKIHQRIYQRKYENSLFTWYIPGTCTPLSKTFQSSNVICLLTYFTS